MKSFFYYINYVWRIAATGFSFCFFGIGAIFLGYIIIPIAQLFVRNSEAKKHIAQHIISLAFRSFVFTLHFLGLINFEFKNFDKLAHDKGCLIISNHPTLIDYVVIISKIKHCDIIVKGSLWHNLFIQKMVRVAGYIPNRQSDETFELIKNTLDKGNNILIFPEGTRSIPNQPLSLKRGTAQIAVRIQTPIRVIKITCKPITLTKQNKWYKIPPQKPRFTLEVMELIDPNEFLKNTPAPSLAARHLTRHLKNILEEDTEHGRS